MKIDCIRAYNYPKISAERKVNFSSNPGWFEDEPLSPLFERLLEHAYGNRGVAYMGSTSPVTDATTLEDVSHNIRNFRRLGNSSYSGQCLATKKEYLPLLRRAGVTRIIDLIDSGELGNLCDQNGLDHYSYDMNWGYGGQSIFNDEKKLISEYSKELSKQGLTKKEFDAKIKTYKSNLAKEKTAAIRKLKNLIDEVNKGHFYMSCENGEYRTVNCLSLVSIFNPEWWGEKIAPATTEFGAKIQNMFKNLTGEHKQILGLSEEYCKYLKNNIANIVKVV